MVRGPSELDIRSSASSLFVAPLRRRLPSWAPASFGRAQPVRVTVRRSSLASRRACRSKRPQSVRTSPLRLLGALGCAGLLLAIAPAPAVADEVVLASGESLQGDVRGDRLRSAIGRVSSTHDLGALAIEEVSIAALVLDLEPRRDGRARLTVTANVYVRESYDRYVSLDFRVVADGEVLAGASRGQIDAEEEKITTRKFVIDLSAEDMAALAAAEEARLRVTMAAIEN